MEGKTAGIITAIIIFIASVAGLYNLNSAQQEQVQQLELQLQQLEQRPQTAGAAFPIPIPGYYFAMGTITADKMGAASVNDTHLAADALRMNYTINNTAVTIAGTTLINMTNESKITVSRASLLEITFSGQVQSSGISYAKAVVDNVEVPATITINSNIGLSNWTTVTAVWVNNTVQSGTHNVWVQGNTSAGALNLLNTTLIVRAYPK